MRPIIIIIVIIQLITICTALWRVDPCYCGDGDCASTLLWNQPAAHERYSAYDSLSHNQSEQEAALIQKIFLVADFLVVLPPPHLLGSSAAHSATALD